jgi:hypothetical protein
MILERHDQILVKDSRTEICSISGECNKVAWTTKLRPLGSFRKNKSEMIRRSEEKTI